MKKLISAVLILAVLFTSTVSFAFSDVESSHWANEYIERLTGEGIINGYEDGTYRPDGLVTKAELAKLVAVTFNREESASSFSDISSHWAEDYIKKCASLFYAPNDKFAPDASATRAEVAYVLANVLSLEKTGELSFPDAATVIDDMKDNVSAAVSAGLIKGYEDGTIRGDGFVTRAEIAALIVRALDYKAPSASFGNELLNLFNEKAKESLSALEIAQALIESPSIPFMGGAMPVEEGFLSGFDDYEVKGFKTGAMFAPMIGSIPFVGYVFELENQADAAAFIEGLEANANLRWNICSEADEMVTGKNGKLVFFVMCPSSLDEEEEEAPEEMPEEEPEEVPDYKAPSSSGFGNTLLGFFNEKAVSGMDALAIAQEITQAPFIPFMSGAMLVEEGYLAGFDDYEVKGFKTGAMFAPMIGSIPFVGYVFELENQADAAAFIEGLEANANLRWNICVSADEMVTGKNGNLVFFVMCPSSLDQEEEEAPEEMPEEEPEEVPEEQPEGKPSQPSDKDHIYTLYPLRDLLLVKNVTTASNENGDEVRKITYAVAGDEENDYTSSIPMDSDVAVVGTKTSLSSIAPGDVFFIDTAFLGYISTIVVVASFDETTPSVAIPSALSYGSGGKYEFFAGTVVSYETKTNTIIYDVSDGASTKEIIVRKNTPASVSYRKGSKHYWESDAIGIIDEGSFVLFRLSDDSVIEAIIKQN